MKQVRFDFQHIVDIKGFYDQFVLAFSLRSDFGANLDALWDTITGEIRLPVEVVFMNFKPQKRRDFAALILLFEEAEEELKGELHFRLQESSC